MTAPVPAAGPHTGSQQTGAVDRQRLIAAIDEMHERAWARGTDGSQADWRVAGKLAEALGWPGDHDTTPDGPWLRARLDEVLR